MRFLLAVLSALLFVGQVTAQVALPYDSGFSSGEGFANEAALSDNWATTDTLVVTADDVAHSDTLSVRIPSANPEHVLSLSFNPTGSSVVFVDYYMQLTASPLPALPLLTTPVTTAMLTLRPNDAGFGEWVFLDGDGLGSGDWLSSGSALSLDGYGRSAWQHITLRLDLSSNLWDAYVDGQMLAADLGFVEAMLAGSEAINIYGNSAGTSYLDSFSLSAMNPLFTDEDSDGMDDVYEGMNGLDTTMNDRGLDADGDGLINIDEYRLGLKSSDTDSDGDGLVDGWEVDNGYSAAINEGLGGAFGDLEGDRLANGTESEIGSSSADFDGPTSILETGTQGNFVAITLIGRGTFTVSEQSDSTSLSE